MDRNRSKQIKPLRVVVATLLLLAVTLSSCTKEANEGEGSLGGESLKIHITFPKSQPPQAANAVAKSNTSAKTKALGDVSGDEGLTFWTSDTPNRATRATDPGTEAERQIDKMTILVFNADGTTLENVLEVDLSSANTSLPTQQPLWESEKTLVVRPITDKNSLKKIYAIANWSKNFVNIKTYTEAMLKNEKTQMGMFMPIVPPLLMIGSSSVNLGTSDSKVTIALERQVAKFNIDITIDKATQASLSDIKWLTDKAQIIATMPDQSYIVGRQSGEWPSLNFMRVYEDIPNASATDDLIKWHYNLYLHECPQKSPVGGDLSPYFQIQLPYRNRVSNVEEYDNYYNVKVKNTGDAEDPYLVARNTIYNFNLKVVGLGSMYTDIYDETNVDFDLTVNPWEEQDIEVDNKPKYFNISRNFIGFQFEETAHKVNIASDISDWKLTKTNGTTLFSFAENKTDPFTNGNLTYAISGTASSATITVTRNSTEPFAQQAMTLVARNIRVPFTVADDNGVIPNSVLEAAGWTASAADRPRGLQIAKRGNVLPSGTALSNDPFAKWSLNEIDTKVTAEGYGFGKSNTAELLKLDAAEYPAVNRCKALGEGWYLPSRDELLLIYANWSLLGSSYPFVTEYYWSASQVNISNAWSVNFHGGNRNSNYKPNSLNFRCVRDI